MWNSCKFKEITLIDRLIKLSVITFLNDLNNSMPDMFEDKWLLLFFDIRVIYCTYLFLLHALLSLVIN